MGQMCEGAREKLPPSPGASVLATGFQGFMAFVLPLNFRGGSETVKNLPAMQTCFDPWIGKIPWRREWLPTPVFLPGESHGQRSLVGYSPWGPKE